MNEGDFDGIAKLMSAILFLTRKEESDAADKS
jgi:hypothetical protein